MESHPSPLPAQPSRLSSPVRVLALLSAAALLGGGAALGGAAAIGAFDEASLPAVQPTTSSQAEVSSRGGTALSINEIYKRSGPGVVQVTSALGANASGGQAQGSGFVLDKEGHIVTNYHVIEDASSIEVRFSNDDTLQATLVGSDQSTDLALLRVDADRRALTPLPLADSDRVEVGDPVVAIGNPFGLERTVTSGIVSALQRSVVAPNNFTIDHVIQTDAPINHGNSGGPLLDSRGEVIGVNSQIETGGVGDGNVGIGFAVPSNTVKSVVAQLLTSGKVEHAFLGVAAVEITTAMANSFRLPVAEGLVVQRVEPGTGASSAGLKAGDEQVVIAGESFRMGGDVIVAAAGKPVSTINELRDVIAAHKPGDRIELEIYRGDASMTLTVTLGRQPASATQ